MKKVFLPSGQIVELPRKTVSHVMATFPNDPYQQGLVYNILAHAQKNTPE